MKRLGFFISFISLALIFSGCNNFLSEPGNSGQNNGNGTVRVSGTLTFSNDIAPYIQNHLTDGRALPSLDSHQFTVLMQAQNSDNSQIVPISVTNNSFSVELSSGNWKFQTHIYYDSTSNPHDDFSSEDYCFSAEEPLTVGTTNINDFKVECEIDTSADVNVPLNFTVYKDTNITKYVFWKEGIVTTEPELISYGSNTYATKNVSTAYTPGLNSFIIYFKDANDNVIYTLEDTILVLKGCENYIYVNNNEGYVDGGQIKITSDVIQKRHANKIYFVDSSVTDDSTRTGTFFDPVASIQKAVNIIDSVNDGTSQFEIRLKSDCTDSSADAYSSDNDYAYVKIRPMKPLTLKICSSDTTKRTIDVNRNSSQQGRIFSLNSSTSTTNFVNLSLDNLILKNGYKNEGGACNFQNGEVTITNCEITNNTAVSNGGAIFTKYTITNLNISDTLFKQNKVDALSTSNNGFGGALYLNSQTNITNCSFIENCVKTNGSGSCCGGAIYGTCGQEKEVNIEGCTFLNNYAKTQGGAIATTSNTILNLNSSSSTNATIFKYNYSNEANAISNRGLEVNIYEKVYFNNSNNSVDPDYSTYSSMDSKIDILYQQQIYIGSGYKYPKVNINFTKADDKLLSQFFPSGSYANDYTYAVIKTENSEGLNLTNTGLTIQDNDSEDSYTNHIYKFLPKFNKYYIKNNGDFTFSPELSSLLQCPDGMDGQDTNTTYKNYIIIKTKEDLENLFKLYSSISESKNNIFKQINDIDLTGQSFTWTSCTFRDIYDGQGYKISGLTISKSVSVGFFTTLLHAVVQNLVLDSPKITYTGNYNGMAGAGGFCNTLADSKIINCSIINGTIKGNTIVGGLVGNHNALSNVVTGITEPYSLIINSSFEGVVERTVNDCSLPYIGGICGTTNGSDYPIYIINSLFKGKLINPKPDDYSSGFIMGNVNSTNAAKIYNCFAHGINSEIGSNTLGIVGASINPFNCYVDNLNFDSTEIPNIPEKISKSNSVSESYFSILNDSYLEGDLVIVGKKENNTKIDIYKYSGSEKKFKNGNLKSVYTISGALNAFCTENNTTDFTSKFGELKPWTYDETNGIHFSTDGTKKDPKPLICPALSSEPDPTDTTPIWIRCEQDFSALDGWNQGNTIELKKDLSLIDDSYEGVGTKISKAVSFTLNGNNHEISYLYYKITQGSFTPALISYANNITIKDLTVHASLELCCADVHASVLVSSMKKGTIENCNCILDYGHLDDSSPSEGLIFGGIVGHITNKFDTDTTYNSSEVDSDNEQGQVIIKNCTMKFLSDFVSSSYSNSKNQIFGGIAGKISGKNTSDNNVVINKCFVGQKTSSEKIYSTRSSTDCDVLGVLKTTETFVDKTSCFGGIVGNVYQSKVTIVNCLNRQAFSIHDSYIGGIVGYYGDFNTTQTNDNGNGLMILNSVAENFDNSLSNNIYVSGIVNSGFTTNNNLKIIGCCSQYGPTSTPSGSGFCYAIANIAYSDSCCSITVGGSILKTYTCVGSTPIFTNINAGNTQLYPSRLSQLLYYLNHEDTFLVTVYDTDYVLWKEDENFDNRFCWDE